jgi:hypothetical protein
MKRKRKHKTTTPPPTTSTKMSGIILEFAWNYAVKDQPDPKLRQHFMNVACTAWNISILPTEVRQNAITAFIDNMRSTSGGEADEVNMKALKNDLNALIAWRIEHYPHIRKLVVNAVLYDEGDNVECRATSVDYDLIAKNKLAL